METLKCWSSLHGYVVFMFLTTVSRGSACEVPSSPECFRKSSSADVYICEWSMNTTVSNVTYDLYFDAIKFRNIKKNYTEILEELLISRRPVDLWVKAHAGNLNCTSPRRSVVLSHIVKFEAPQNISASWLINNLILVWDAEDKRALAEIWFRRDGHSSWEKRLANTTLLTAQSSQVQTSPPQKSDKYQVIVENLLNHSAYQVQIRHRSTQAGCPLWSKWSKVVTVPAELEHEPEVNIQTEAINGTREVTLTWKARPHVATVGGVTYWWNDTQSSLGCPCKTKAKTRHHNDTHTVIYVSYSAVNISVIARNLVGSSPPALIQVPAESTAGLKSCGHMTLDAKLRKKTCKQWYELQDQDSRPENVISLATRKLKERKQVKKRLQDHVRYLYFEHECDNGKPRTVKRCLFYKKEGAPLKEPPEFTALSDAHNSAILSWKAVATEHRRGFLTHYSLCSVKISSQDGLEECQNISALLISYRLENLAPGTKYNISLAAVTQEGEGPRAISTINTLPEKQMNVWLSLSLLTGFFLCTTMCTVVLKRIKSRIFPPVPKPVIPELTDFQPENQEAILERKEEVNDLTLLQPPSPKGKSVPEDVGEINVLQREWDDGSDEDVENEMTNLRMSGGSSDDRPGSTEQVLRSSREGEITDLEQVDNEIAMLIYRNGLVFDVKTDST